MSSSIKNTKRASWVFICPKHGVEQGLFCDLAYSDDHVDCWKYVEYVFKVIPTNNKKKKEWVKIMNLTRQYNGRLPS